MHPVPFSAHVGMLEEESRSAGPLTGWQNRLTVGFAVVMTKLSIILMASGSAAVSRYILRTQKTQRLFVFTLLLVL